MSECKRQSEALRLFSRFCLLTSVFYLLSCGFHPIYGSHDDGSPVAAELNQVAIDGIPERAGQTLRNKLIDRMHGKGRPSQPKYHLEVTLSSTEEGIGLLPNAITSLTELTLTANYSLKDATGKNVMSATAHAVANYSTLQEQYAALAAREGAYQRSLNEISNQIVNRVSLYFSEGNTITPGPPATTPVPIPGQVPGIVR